MIEILSKKDIEKVDDDFKEYLHYSFARLPSDYKYPEFGYFVVIEKYEDLTKPIQLKHHKLPSLLDKDFFDTYLELVELKDNIIEIVTLLDSEFGIALIMKQQILPSKIFKKLMKG